MHKHTEPVKHLDILVEEAVSEEFSRVLPSYGERSRLIRELFRQQIRASDKLKRAGRGATGIRANFSSASKLWH